MSKLSFKYMFGGNSFQKGFPTIVLDSTEIEFYAKLSTNNDLELCDIKLANTDKQKAILKKCGQFSQLETRDLMIYNKKYACLGRQIFLSA